MARIFGYGTPAVMQEKVQNIRRDIYVEPRTVDVHIRRLRKAINIEGATDLVRTVRSAGYALDAED